jgi:hypothetical protein
MFNFSSDIVLPVVDLYEVSRIWMAQTPRFFICADLVQKIFHSNCFQRFLIGPRDVNRDIEVLQN